MTSGTSVPATPPPTGTTNADVFAVLESAYPPRLAEDWDSVGLVCGDPTESVDSVLACVDVTDDVVEHALVGGYQLIVAHHPLLLGGVDGVGAHTAKGRIVHRLIRGGCALYTAHTNADRAQTGVSDALANALGIVDTAPLVPAPTAALDKWVVMIPASDAEQFAEAMFNAGAGEIGDYRRCCWRVTGDGQFEPRDGARPAIGTIGQLVELREDRVEMVAPRARRTELIRVLRAAHPYEEPAFDILEQAPVDSDEGLGRVGILREPMTLQDFTTHSSRVLSTAAWGIRAAGDPDMMIRTVAVCGGAGDSLLPAARASGADVYLTGDLRHHSVDEHSRLGPPALIDAGHWATEFPWCGQVSVLIDTAMSGNVRCSVYEVSTDPFTLHANGS